MIKLKLPEKKNIKAIKKYFAHHKILNHLINDDKTFAPDLNDLYQIHELILLNKRTTVLEFGCGWSTIIIKNALEANKKKYFSKLKKLRKKNNFEIFTLDNQKKFLKFTNEKNRKILGKKSKINLIYSQNRMTKFNGKICSEYLRLPIINPDFIYLDGPDPRTVAGKINGFNLKHLELMPMACDILKIEHFLIPGTIVLVDGRTANVRFLKSNFQRNWSHIERKNNDQHIFFLNEKSLGPINNKMIDFYK